MVKAQREKEHRANKFLAAMKGIDLDSDNDGQDKFAEIERRAKAKLQGVSEEKLEFEEFGLDIEIEE